MNASPSAAPAPARWVRRLVTSAVWTFPLMLLSIGILALQLRIGSADTSYAGRLLEGVGVGLLWPGFLLAALLGLRGGPDGMPSVPQMYALAFGFWWALIDIVRVLWRDWGSGNPDPDSEP